MIRGINIAINAAHPELPLVEATTFVGSPSSVFIRGVPKSCGNWRITAVSVVVTYPDNTTTTRVATESAQGVWVATIPGTATSGRTIGGFRILADGEDENGAAVTGYVLGFADFAVFSMLPVPAPGETFYLFRYFDAQPATPKKGDAAIIGGVLKYYNGAAWAPFADLSNYYTKAETDNAIERVAAYYITADAQGHAFATYAALVGASTYYSGGVARVPTRNDYAVVLADETHSGAEYRYIYAIADGATTGHWEAQYPIETNDYTGLANKPQINGNTLTGNKTGAALGLLDTSAVVAPSTDSSASGKAADAKATGDALALITPDWSQSSVYNAYDCVKYNGAYYYAKSDIAANTAWNADNWGSLANLAALAHKFLPLAGGEMTGPLTARKGIVVGLESGNDFDGFKVNANGIAMMTNHAGGQSTFGEILAEVQDVPNKANRALNPTAGNLAALDANGNPTDSTIPAANVALKGDLRYTLPVTATIIGTASSEVVSGETVYYGEATLADRTQNPVFVIVALDELRVTIPPAVSGKVRDFGLIVGVGLGEGTALAAPALVPVAPTGETITMMNADGEMPTLADGTTTAPGFTALYFTEITTGTFLVKGEQVEEVA